MPNSNQLQAALLKNLGKKQALPNNPFVNACLLSLIPPQNLLGPIFYLAQDSLELTRLSSAYRIWSKFNRQKLACQFWAEEADPPLNLLYQLARKRKQIIATVRANINAKVVPLDLLLAAVIKLRIGQSLKRDDLIKRLILDGFSFNTSANQPGLLAKRGSLVDLWPNNYHQPLRLEFDSGSLTDIHTFNPTTNKINRQLTRAEVVPQAVATAVKAPLAHYLNDPVSLMASDSSLVDYADWHIYESPKFAGQWQRFAEELPKLQKKYQRVICLSQKKDALSALLAEHKIPTANLFIYPLTSQLPEVTYGFSLPDDQTLVLTDYDIFGWQSLKKTAKRKINKTFIASLKIGDYVVHADHGIAKFTSMTKAVVDEIEREYFVLSYAGTDKLYLPVDQADKIDKYIGVGKPKIHTLGRSSAWPQLVKKIKEDTIKTAKELLNLYAQRQLAHSPSFQDFAEERELAHDFPFQETADQLTALTEVMADLKKDSPTDRLICGDVGFGKTEVAIRAAFKAVLNGYQAVILCPTTILAQQHHDTFTERLKNFPVNVAALSRFQNAEEQSAILTKLLGGQIDIVIGTHRLLSKDISFKNLGLLIIDEEQRFGVQHKEQLKKLKSGVHTLTLTATPIPRTLHFSLSGVRDISVIETSPAGRLPIKTEVQPFSEQLVKNALIAEFLRGGQAYYLYNDVQTISLKAEELLRLLPQAKIGIAHGQLPESRLAQVMHDFDLKKINLLVCSTIIENGLDLPNVNTLIVENSPKLGLAQLYQLRGRVGRGARQAYAYFLYHSAKLPGLAGQRLRALKDATELGSGFQLAMRDLELRGAGNILGKKQHGKVSAIGLSLYQRLLEQTVEEIKTGTRPEPISHVSIDLPIAIGIPISFEPDERKRLALYQKLSRLDSAAELKQFIERPTGSAKLPDQLANLLEVLELKLLAQQTDIIAIDAVNHREPDGRLKSKISLTFKKDLDYQKVSQLLAREPYWQDASNKLKIDLSRLGVNWLNQLKQAIMIFQK